MKEFGSDYHYIKPDGNKDTLFALYPKSNLYAIGRHAIQALIYHKQWKRIWMPDYFCYEIIDTIKKTGIQICFYQDNPLLDDSHQINKLKFEEGDVLLRINYFGLRAHRSNEELDIPVIEDHSHDLVGEWAMKSNADWCIASLRKTLPIPEGGILWSPKNHKLPEMPKQSERNLILIEKRWRAMHLKKDYLEDKISNKEEYRKLFIDTESEFEKLLIAPITKDCKGYLNKFDIKGWSQKKQNNWNILSGIQSDKIQILKKETITCDNFSFILLFQTVALRNKIRLELINKNVFPAILWEIPSDKSVAKSISDRMISIACDARYTVDSIQSLKKIIEDVMKYV